MKKQILFIALFVLAALANVTKSYGQCSPTSLTPSTGIDYPYGVAISGSAGTSPTYLWYITQNTDILAAEASPIDDATTTFFTVEAGSAYNNTTGGTNELHLKWTPAAVNQTFYVVVKYSATSTAGCPIENMKVYEVKPINTFLLAVTGSQATGGATQAANCAADITGAVITAATPTVQYTYGQNTIYYEITASGILGAWKPSIRIPALNAAGNQAYVSADWSADGGTTWTGLTGFTANGSQQDLGLAVDPTVADAVDGTKYLVRLVIDNHDYETITDQVLNLKVDGFLPTAYTVSDIIGSGATPCAEADDFTVGVTTKNADYTISARPTIGVGTLTGAGAFVPKNP